jgi:hypothetical protein
MDAHHFWLSGYGWLVLCKKMHANLGMLQDDIESPLHGNCGDLGWVKVDNKRRSTRQLPAVIAKYPSTEKTQCPGMHIPRCSL